MASHRDGSNPLRPYYIPPSIGETLEPNGVPGPRPLPGGNVTGRYASKARDIFSDIDYKDYIAEPSPSAVQTLKELVDELLWKYTSVLMAQPFDVAKTILQVRKADDLEGFPFPQVLDNRSKTPTRGANSYDHYADSDSDQDEPAYFTSNIPSTPTPSRQPRRSPRSDTSSPSRSPRIPSASKAAPPDNQLVLRDPSAMLGTIWQLWGKEGAWGVWKGSNASFLYTVLQSLLENWSRSLLSALFNVPDLGVSGSVDRIVDLASPYPWASLCVAAAAAVTTGLVLAPIDLIRTRLLLTPTSRQPRRTLPMLRSLPSYICPSAIFLPTILHSLIHPILTLSAPLVLRTQFRIDRDLNPTAFSFAKFVSSSVALFVKLPIETVLRRGQMSVLTSPAYVKALEPAPAKLKTKGQGKQAVAPAATTMETIVPVGRYDGTFGTMYSIVYDEGSRQTQAQPAAKGKGKMGVSEIVYRKGQGMPGLWRGWKVSWWGLVSLWAISSIGGGGDGEF